MAQLKSGLSVRAANFRQVNNQRERLILSRGHVLQVRRHRSASTHPHLPRSPSTFVLSTPSYAEFTLAVGGL